MEQLSVCVDCQLRQGVEDVELHEHSQAHALHAYFARLKKETQKSKQLHSYPSWTQVCQLL